MSSTLLYKHWEENTHFCVLQFIDLITDLFLGVLSVRSTPILHVVHHLSHASVRRVVLHICSEPTSLFDSRSQCLSGKKYKAPEGQCSFLGLLQL